LWSIAVLRKVKYFCYRGATVVDPENLEAFERLVVAEDLCRDLIILWVHRFGKQVAHEKYWDHVDQEKDCLDIGSEEVFRADDPILKT